MKERALVVGGQLDGKFIEGKLDRYIQHPIQEPLPINLGMRLPKMVHVRYEEYTLRTFSSVDNGDLKRIYMYGLSSLSDIDIQMRLINNYMPLVKGA